MEMSECPACDPEYKFDYVFDRRNVKNMDWKCDGCRTVWVAHIFERKTMGNMKKCVCCPEQDG